MMDGSVDARASHKLQDDDKKRARDNNNNNIELAVQTNRDLDQVLGGWESSGS